MPRVFNIVAFARMNDVPGGSSGFLLFLNRSVGLILIAVGIYFGFTVFLETRSLLGDPQTLLKWTALRGHIQAIDGKQGSNRSEKNLLKIDNKITLLGERELYIAGGYFTLFLGLLFIWILGRLAVAFLHGGARILMADAQQRKSKYNS